jgi:hypothetical protein
VREVYLIQIPALGIPDDPYLREFIFIWKGRKISLNVKFSLGKGNVEETGKKEVITWKENNYMLHQFDVYGNSAYIALHDFREALIAHSNKFKSIPAEVLFTF